MMCSKPIDNSLEEFYIIRHGVKCYSNGNHHTNQLDSPIKRDQREAIFSTLSLARERGMKPERIVCSPFLRTRETAMIVAEFFRIQEIVIDRSIGEYLGNQQRSKYPYPFEKTTYSFRPLWETNIGDYQERINNFWNLRETSEKTIYVTHGLAISTIVKKYDCDYYPDEGHGIMFRGGILSPF